MAVNETPSPERQAAFMSALVTEHFVLQTAATATITEAASRTSLRLFAVEFVGRVCLVISAGVANGVAASMWTTQLTASLLFGVEPRDPVTLALAIATLSGTGLLAALPPAWDVSRVDPSVALRSD
jgi:hypothetical protein